MARPLIPRQEELVKTIRVEFVLEVPDAMPLSEAARRLEVLPSVAGLVVSDCDPVWDEDDGVPPEQAAYERRCYEQDMTAALRM